MNEKNKAKIMGINRFRMGTDGKGISTLVLFYGCQLNCKYCLNPQCKNKKTHRTNINPAHLVKMLSVDDIYFRTTGGGVVFGGGEPLLHAKYIETVCNRMPNEWKKRIETSLNVPWNKIELLIPYIDQWIIDIKDSQLDIYKEYTGVGGELVYENIKKLHEKVNKEKILIRIPRIPGYNKEENIINSIEVYSNFGEIDVFEYR